jgi:dihydroorotase
MKKKLIKGAHIINEGKIERKDLLINGERIESVEDSIAINDDFEIFHADGKLVIPGLIDDQVHFREPGLTHKGDIFTESRAAVAGGITSFMEMPNTVPQTLTQELLEQKYDIAAQHSLANYSFYMGASNNNIDEVLRTDPENVCGVKVFMGSSTGNMLVNDPDTLQNIFSKCKMLIATHCEDEATIKNNLQKFKDSNETLSAIHHPLIRSREACYKSSSMAVELAKKYNSRLHVLHISTEDEIALFSNDRDLVDKNITAEACVHHLWFSDEDYSTKGNFIKWNPAVKTSKDREAILQAVINGKIDVIATDHAPHTLQEKSLAYADAPSGGPLVQHSLVAMIELYHQKKISLETIVERMCHAPAKLFRVRERGFIREGYFADLVIIDPNNPWTVAKDNLYYKCGWSPFEGQQFISRVTHTFVNGHLAFVHGSFDDKEVGKRMQFNVS